MLRTGSFRTEEKIAEKRLKLAIRVKPNHMNQVTCVISATIMTRRNKITLSSLHQKAKKLTDINMLIWPNFMT